MSESGKGSEAETGPHDSKSDAGKGRLLDTPPFGLPEGWEAYEYTYETGKSAGNSYQRFFKGSHRYIPSVRQCIALDAEDSGTDPAPLLKEYDTKKRKSLPDEAFESFLPEESGLHVDTLALLPPDAPSGHLAFKFVRQGVDAGGNLRSEFTRPGVRLQVTESSAAGSMYAAFRIARACYVKFQDEGFGKDELTAFRNEYLAKLKGKSGRKRKGREAVAVEKRQPTEPTLNVKPEEPDPSKKHSPDQHKGIEIDAQQAEPEKHTQTQKSPTKPAKKSRQGKSGRKVIEELADATSGVEADSNTLEGNRKREDLVNGASSGGESDVESQIGSKKRKRDKKQKKEKQKNDKQGRTLDKSSEAAEENHHLDGVKAEVLTNGSGRDEQILPQLPPDAPDDHIAFTKCQVKQDTFGYDVVGFQGTFPGTGRLAFQMSLRKAGGKVEMAQRIARACYMKAEGGASKAEVYQLRTELCAAAKSLPAASGAEVQREPAVRKDDEEPNGTAKQNVALPAASGAEVLQREPAVRKDDEEPSGTAEQNVQHESDSSSSSSSSDASSSPRLSKSAKADRSTTSKVSGAPALPRTEAVGGVINKDSKAPAMPFKKKVCAKMMVRAALRCSCHFEKQCPLGSLR